MFRDSWTGKTIGMALDQAVQLYGDREAFVFPDKRLSFRNLGAEADNVARSFLKLGIQPGVRVGIWMAGHREWPSLFFGLAKAGTVLVPINSRYKPNELEYAIHKSRISALVFKHEIVKEKNYRAILADVCQWPASNGGAEFRNTEFPDLQWIVAIGEKPVPGLLSFDRLLQQTRNEDNALVERAGKKKYKAPTSL